MAQRFYLPREQVFTNLGAIGAGWELYFYETGTTTPRATYSDTALTTPNTNPVVADSNGRLGDIFFDDAADYKAVLKDTDGNTIWTADPVDPKVFTLNDFDPRPTSFWGTTGGSSTAYTLDADPDLTAYSSTNTFYAQIHTTSGATPTINVNGLGALNIKKYSQQGTKVNPVAGDMVGGQRYEFTNDGTDIIVLNPKTNLLYLGAAVTLTESSNEITLDNTVSNYVVDTSSGAVTLNTITGMQAGQKITLGISSASNTMTITTGADNIVNPSGIDIILETINDKVELLSDGTNVIVTSVSSAGATPIQLLETKTASSSASINFTTVINGTFSIYKVEMIDVLPATDNVYLSSRVSVNGGSSYISSSYIGGRCSGSNVDGPTGNTSNTDRIDITSNAAGWGVDSGSTNGVTGEWIIINPSGSSRYKDVRFSGSYDNNSGNYTYFFGSGRYEGAATAINAFQFFFSSGNIASGTFKLYGVK